VFEAKLLVDQQGRLIVAGSYFASGEVRYGPDTRDLDFLVARLTLDGTLDPSFGVSGRAVLGVGRESRLPDYDSLDSVAIIGDHIYVAGAGNLSRAVVARLTADGRLDSTYGKGGWWTADRGGEGLAAAFDPAGGAWLFSSNGTWTRAWHVAPDGTQLSGPMRRLDLAPRHEIVRAASSDSNGGALVVVVAGGSSDYSGRSSSGTCNPCRSACDVS
jgi:hypothetical protein